MTVWSRLEAAGGSRPTFCLECWPARRLEGGIRFGLGSTLAMSKAALAKAGGLEPLVEYLADDYEMGERIAKAGYRVELCGRGGGDDVPAYNFRGFRDHQLRWAPINAGLAQTGVRRVRDYVCFALGDDDLRCQRVAL